MISSASDSAAASSFKPARTADRGGNRSDDAGFSALVDSNVAADDTSAARAGQANASRQNQRQERASDTRDSSEAHSGGRDRRASDPGTSAKTTDKPATDGADVKTSDDTSSTADTKSDAEPVVAGGQSDAKAAAPAPEAGDVPLPDENAAVDGEATDVAMTGQATVPDTPVGVAVPPRAAADAASTQGAGDDVVVDATDARRAGASQVQRKPDGVDAQKGEQLQQDGTAKAAGSAASQAQSAPRNPEAGVATMDDPATTTTDADKPVTAKTERAASQTQAQINADAGSADAAASTVKDKSGDAAAASASHPDLKPRAERTSARDSNGVSRPDTGSAASADSRASAAMRAAAAHAEDPAAPDAPTPEAKTADAAKSDPIGRRAEPQTAASAHTSGSDARALVSDIATGLRAAMNDNGTAQTTTLPAHAIQNMQAQSIQQSAPMPAASATSAPAAPFGTLAVEIATRSRDGSNRFEIRLDPKELGRIDVRLDVDRHGNVTSRLFVERAETLDLLRRDAPNLERALQDAGLKTSDNGLQFSLRDQGQSQRDDGQTERARISIADEDIAAADVAGRSYGRTLGGAGGLDIRV